jgi:hypothetical protein
MKLKHKSQSNCAETFKKVAFESPQPSSWAYYSTVAKNGKNFNKSYRLSRVITRVIYEWRLRVFFFGRIKIKL